MEIIDIARWLAENHEELSKITNQYPTSERDKLDILNRIVCQTYNQLSYEDVAIMFEDERLRLIIDRYYLKQLH